VKQDVIRLALSGRNAEMVSSRTRAEGIAAAV
jgi:hypothetical protein